VNLACAVLAAGRSARLGQPKQLLSVGGQALIRHIVEVACASRCAHVAVVVGASEQAVLAAVGSSRAVPLRNPEWQAGGLASSMHVAVHWARGLAVEALLLLVCDQPHLTTLQLDRLCDAYQRERRSIASRYAGALGVPALIEARHFADLLAISGDRGAASLLRSGIDVGFIDWPEGAVDLDTAQDVALFTAQSS
jgi:molybdenum cofactor cytidylyltransferase